MTTDTIQPTTTNAPLAELLRTSNGKAPDWLDAVRRAAASRFEELGLPTVRHEEWRYTNITPLTRIPFRRPALDTTAVTPADIDPFVISELGGHLLVFVNGRYAPKLSRIDSLPDGVTVTNLAAAVQAHDPVVAQYLTQFADFRDSAFTAFNTALMDDGVFVNVPRGVALEAPVQALFIQLDEDEPVAACPRNLIVAAENSRVTLVETYAGVGAGANLISPVTELIVGENGNVDHYMIQREGAEAFHVGTFQVHQQRTSNVTSHVVSLGGRIARNDIDAVLDGEGCDCTLAGLSVLGGEQHVDNHLRVEHAKPHCDSREFFKGVYDGHARGVFSGRIFVAEDAQKTDAKQSNMSLLLSDEAQVDSKPQLEIFADDVKCTHGATIGQVEPEAIFYLRSRGMTEQMARSLLIHAFAQESIQNIGLDAVRAHLEHLLFDRLPYGDLLRESV